MHPDLAPNYLAAASADCESGVPLPLQPGNDAAGHGTHTAGTVGAQNPSNIGRRYSVAPEVDSRFSAAPKAKTISSGANMITHFSGEA